MANVAQPGRRKAQRPRSQNRPVARSVGRAAGLLGLRAAGGHAVVLAPPLQPARSDSPALSDFDNYSFLLTDPSLLDALWNTAGAGRRRSARLDCLRLPVCGAVRPGILRPLGRAAAGDRAVLRHADGQRADLEEPADASGQRAVRALHALVGICRRSTGSAVWPLTSIGHHRRLAMGAVRDADPPHRDPVARPRADGGGAHGRREAVRCSSSSRCRISPRPIAVVVMIETIFLLSIFAEILVTTNGGPGDASTNLPYLDLQDRRCSTSTSAAASAGGIVAVVLANIVASSSSHGRAEPRLART